MAKYPMFEVADGAVTIWRASDQEPCRLVLPNVTIKGYIGKGAHGLVFDAVDNLNRTVAVKVWFRYNVECIERAREEMTKTARLEERANVARVYQFGVHAGVPFAIIERVDGVTAKDWLRRWRPGPIDRLWMWKSYSTSLRGVHGAGMLHGDPHLGNIIVGGAAIASGPNQAVEGLTPTDVNDERRPIHGPSFSIRLTDVGSSLLWAKGEDFRVRERAIMYETAHKLLGDPLERAVDISWAKDHEVLARIVDNYVDVVLKAEDILFQQREWREHDFLNEVTDVATLVVATPVFDLRWVRSTVWMSHLLHTLFLAEVLRGSWNNLDDQRAGNVPTHVDDLQSVITEYERWRKEFVVRARAKP